MIDAIEQASCKVCGRPIPQSRGPRKRQFCSSPCKQSDYRARHGVTIAVTIEDKQAKERIAELEQELVKYRQIATLMDRAKMEARFMELGEQVQYQTLTTLNILGGYGYWQDFMRRADNETLLKAIAAVEYYLEGLIALRGDPQQRRIAELERENKDLQARLDYEERYLTDTRKRDFKIWLRSHPQPTDSNFFKRFLDDRDLPTSKSRANYEALLRLHKERYSDEDIELFRDAWKRMLFNQS